MEDNTRVGMNGNSTAIQIHDDERALREFRTRWLRWLGQKNSSRQATLDNVAEL